MHQLHQVDIAQHTCERTVHIVSNARDQHTHFNQVLRIQMIRFTFMKNAHSYQFTQDR